MVVRSKGFRSKARHKLKKKIRKRGKLSVTKVMQKFEIGERAYIDIEPGVQKGMPYPRFQGRCGIVKGKRGRAYIVEIEDGKKKKEIIALPVHLKKV